MLNPETHTLGLPYGIHAFRPVHPMREFLFSQLLIARLLCFLLAALVVFCLPLKVPDALGVPSDGKADSADAGIPNRWPGRWETVDPEAAGFDTEGIEQAVTRIGKMDGLYGVIVVRGARIVAERYFREAYRDKPHNLKSASKVVISTLTGIAVDEGLLDVDRSIAAWLSYPDLFRDPQRRAITARHLLTMTSGLEPTSYQTYNAWISRKDWVRAALERPMVAKPGTVFQYSTGDTHILSGILTAVSGTGTRAYAEKKLFGPMGIRVQGWDEDPGGVSLGGNNLSLLPRDMAKLGLLYLNGGTFGGRRIVSRSWIQDAVRPNALGDHDVYGAYGYLWYVRPGGMEAFSAVGFGGQTIYVAPPEDCVIVITATLESKGRSWEKQLIDLVQKGILGSLREEAPTPVSTSRLRVPEVTGADLPRQMASVVAVEGSRNTQPIARGTTVANVVLRSAPGTGAVRLGLVPLDTEVTIFETRNRWHRILHDRRQGWISGEYVRIRAREPLDAALQVAESERAEAEPSPGSEGAVPASAPQGAGSDSAPIPEFARLQIQTLTRALESAESIRKAKDARLAALQRELEEQRAEAEKKDRRRQELSDQLASAYDDIADLEEQARKAQAGESRLRAALQKREAEATSLEQGAAAARKEIKRLEVVLSSAETDRRAAAERTAVLEGELASRKRLLAEAEASSREQVANLSRSRARVAELERTLQTSREKGKRLQADLAAARALLVEERKAMSDREQQLQHEVAGLSEQLQQRDLAAVQLKAELEALSGDAAAARSEADRLGKAIAALQSDRSAQAHRLESLEKDLAAAQKERQRLETALAALQTDQSEKAGRIANLEKELAAKTQLLADAASKGRNQAVALAGSQERISELERSLQSTESERERLDAETDSLREALAADRSAAEAVSSERDRLSEEVAQLRRVLAAQREKAEASAAERSRLRSELSSTRDALSQEREASAVRDQQLRQELASLSEELQQRDVVQRRMEEEGRKLAVELGAARKETERLRASLEAAEADRAAGREQLGAAMERIERLDQERVAAMAQRSKMQGELAAVKEELSQRRGEGRWLRSAVEKLTAELTDARRELEVLTSQIAGSGVEAALGPPVGKSLDSPADSESAAAVVAKLAPQETKTTDRNEPPLPAVDLFVKSWAEDWSRKDADAYLAHYSRSFRPDRGRSQEAWRNIRRRRLAKPKFIEVTIGDLSVKIEGSERAVATFQQTYRSDTYADTVRKVLELVVEEGGWKIRTEKSQPIR